MSQSLLSQGIEDDYTFGRPVTGLMPRVLDRLAAIKHISENTSSFKPLHHSRNGCSFPISLDDEKRCVPERRKSDFADIYL